MDRVGLEARVLEDLGDHAALVGNGKILRHRGIERGRRGQQGGLGRADEEHVHAAAFRELHHGTHVGFGLRAAQAAQEIVAADAKEDEPRRVFVECRGQALERLRRDFARNAGAHHAPADQAFELRRVAFVFVRTGAIGEAVAESEDDGVRGQRLKLGALAACRQTEREREGEKAS